MRSHGVLSSRPKLNVSIDEAQRRATHGWLARHDPLDELIGELIEWERESGEQILPRPPEGPQLEAALALLRGEHPSRHRIQSHQ